MRRPHGDPFLTTRQVAVMCGTTEETVLYFAQAGSFAATSSASGWEFLLSDAQPFCEEWRTQKTAALGRRGKRTVRAPARSDGRRVRTGPLNAAPRSSRWPPRSASTATGRSVSPSPPSICCSSPPCRRSRSSDVAKRLRWQAGGWTPTPSRWDPEKGHFPVRGVQTACLLATVGFVAVTAASDDSGGDDAGGEHP